VRLEQHETVAVHGRIGAALADLLLQLRIAHLGDATGKYDALRIDQLDAIAGRKAPADGFDPDG
jgi:hypothetical protein